MLSCLPSGRELDQQENNNVIQISDSFFLQRGRSALTAGFEHRRNLSNGVTLGLENVAGGGGREGFLTAFTYSRTLPVSDMGQPFAFSLAVDRFSNGRLQLADPIRRYRSNEYALFIQDDFKLRPGFQ